MNALDATPEQFEKTSHELSPSLLTVILDTNPAAWSLLSPTLTLSSTVANLLVFINAHLAGNYLNKVGVIASHCDKAQWLYPTPTEQRPPVRSAHDRQKRQAGQQHRSEGQTHPQSQDLTDSTKRLRLSNGPTTLNLKPPTGPTPSSSATEAAGNKYRPFRLVEEELIKNLSNLLSSTTPDVVSSSTSTMIAGALTLALSHINRESISYAESLIGSSTGADMDGSANNAASAAEATTTTALQSRILLVSASPSTDLAHQYIPIMNAIFACQRLAIPIDILQLPLPLPSPTPKPSSSASPSSSSSLTSGSNSTVFLQQAADATKGIFIPVQLPKPSSTPATSSSASSTSSASQALLTYLLTSFLPSPATRAAHLILPTRIDVDFRAACFCHRNVVSTGFVCSICLSIFCSVPENGDCLTCGTHLTLGNYGARPAVVARRKKARAR